MLQYSLLKYLLAIQIFQFEIETVHTVQLHTMFSICIVRLIFKQNSVILVSVFLSVL